MKVLKFIIALLLAIALPKLGYTASFAYTANNGATITAYTLDNTTGTLTLIGNYAAVSSCSSLTLDPSQRFLYVTNFNANSISAFSINPSSGALIPFPGTPTPTGNGPGSITTDPLGRFLYTANQNSLDVSVYSINSLNGTLTEITGSPFPVPFATAAVTAIAINKSGRFAYVSNNDANGPIYTFKIFQDTGALSFLSTTPAGSGTDWLAVDPKNRFLYAANLNDQTVSAYKIGQATGGLKPIAGSPFFVNGAPQQVIVDPTGEFVLTANDGSSGNAGVSVLQIDQLTGALAQLAGSPFTAGLAPTGVVITSDSKFVYSANQGSNTVSGFVVNPSNTFILTPTISSPYLVESGPVKIVTTDGPVQPPENLMGCQKSFSDGANRAFVNFLTWDAPSSGVVPAFYEIYRPDGTLIATIPSTAPLKFKDYYIRFNRSYTYSVISVDPFGNRSAPATVTVGQCGGGGAG